MNFMKEIWRNSLLSTLVGVIIGGLLIWLRIANII